MSNPAETYESFLVPAMFEPLIPHLIGVAKPRPGERILDVACGTGIVAREIAGRLDDAQVTGIDLNPLMLGVAQIRAEEDGVTVAWQECRAEALPFPDGAFDLVTCQHGLQFVPEKSEALSEIYRVLDDSGRAVVITWGGLDRHPFFAELDAACVRQLGDSATGDPFSLGEPDELAEMFTDAGFSDVEVHPYSFTARYADPELALALILRSATAAIPELSKLDAAVVDALIEAVQEDMAESIRERTTDDRLEIPLHALATVGWKPAFN